MSFITIPYRVWHNDNIYACAYTINGKVSVGVGGEAVCVLERVVCGHYIYKATWTPSVAEILGV